MPEGEGGEARNRLSCSQVIPLWRLKDPIFLSHSTLINTHALAERRGSRGVRVCEMRQKMSLSPNTRLQSGIVEHSLVNLRRASLPLAAQAAARPVRLPIVELGLALSQDIVHMVGRSLHLLLD